MSIQLPLDIVETIIDIVAQHDRSFSALTTCALVCSGFLQFCRKHIFASVILDGIYHLAPELQDLLSTSPEIGQHIRYLNYHIQNADFQDASLVETFKKITLLKSLALGYPKRRNTRNSEVDGDSELLWNDNPLRPALLHLMHLQTLTRLNLWEIDNFVVADLFPCTNLESLETHRVRVFGTVTNLPLSPLRLSRLAVGTRSLVISKLRALQCADGRPFIEYDCIVDLSIEISKPADAIIARRLLPLCKRLTTINIGHEAWDYEADFIEIGLAKLLHPSMQTLTSLEFEILHDSRIEGVDPLSGLASELEAMKDINIVKSISIKVFIQTDRDCERDSEWNRLDAALAYSGWPELQQVSLKITIWSYYREDDGLKDALSELPQTLLRGLSESASISFTFGVSEGYPGPMGSMATF